eukprot:6050509-Pleurochrysis_carterae.AAC.1
MLGLTVEIVNALEWDLQVLDAKLGRKPLDEKLAEELEQLASAAETAAADLQKWEAQVNHHENSIRVIEQTEGSAEAIARGKKRANRSRDYQPLPLEAEYGLHRAKLLTAQRHPA